jgi:hypothetical protein
MELSFGQHLPGVVVDGKELRAPVFDENEVRAAAGLTMVIGAVAFSFAYFDQNYIPLQVVTTVFFVEFLIRLTAGIRYSPMGVVARAMTFPHPPEWGLREAQAVRVDAGPRHVVVDGDHHQQRHPRHPAAHDLSDLPVADVDGIGPRHLRRL